MTCRSSTAGLSDPGATVYGMDEARDMTLDPALDPELDEVPDPVLDEVLDEVLAVLPGRAARALDRPDVRARVAVLLDAGWRPAEIGGRLARLPLRGDLDAQACQALELLAAEESGAARRLRLHGEAVEAARELGLPEPPLPRGLAAGRAPWLTPAGEAALASPPEPTLETGRRPATDEERAHWVAQARASLRQVSPGPRPRPPASRRRPACALCDGESAFFVTHEVHLCGPCVAMLAAGQVRVAHGA